MSPIMVLARRWPQLRYDATCDPANQLMSYTTTTRQRVNPMADRFSKLLAKIEAKTAPVAIIGLGYVGLPLASAFARNGVPVLGFDVDAVKVHKLQSGRSYIKHISDEAVASMRANRFEATDKFD